MNTCNYKLSKEEIVQLSDKLYDAFTNNRDQLANFLKTDIRLILHNNLKELFLEINKKWDHTNGNSITELLLGSIGPECNRQKAIYELPTFELMVTILSISKYFKISTIEEIMAGQGLFGALFDNYFKTANIILNVTDGMCQCETFGNNPYYPVEKKYIIEYLTEKNDENKMFVTLWPNIRTSKIHLNEFINKIKPKIFILVGQKGIYKKHFKLFKKAKYQSLTFVPYQICYRDTITNTNEFSSLPDINNSSLTIFIEESIKNDLKDESMKDDLKELHNKITSYTNNFRLLDSLEIFRKEEQQITDKYILKFFAEQQLIPNTIITNVSDDEIKELIKCLYNLSISKESVYIPEYLTSLPEFKFWYQLYTTNKFPKLLKTYERFNEFKTYHEKIESSPFIPSSSEMKNKNVFPYWVNNKQDALKCLVLDYSTEERYKLWKQSRAFMNEYYNGIFNI